MSDRTLRQRLREINNSTLHNMRFLLESYSEEVLVAIDEHIVSMERKQEEPLDVIEKEVQAVIHTLRGIEEVIAQQKETRDENGQLQASERD